MAVDRCGGGGAVSSGVVAARAAALSARLFWPITHLPLGRGRTDGSQINAKGVMRQ